MDIEGRVKVSDAEIRQIVADYVGQQFGGIVIPIDMVKLYPRNGPGDWGLIVEASADVSGFTSVGPRQRA